MSKFSIFQIKTLFFIYSRKIFFIYLCLLCKSLFYIEEGMVQKKIMNVIFMLACQQIISRFVAIYVSNAIIKFF